METLQNVQPNTARRTMRLRTLLAISFSALAILVVIAVTTILYLGFSQQIREDLRKRVMNLAELAALQQNGDEFIQIASETDPLYRKVREQNTRIASIDEEIAYVYTMRKDEQGIYFVVDASGLNYSDTALFGERYTDPSPLLLENFDTLETAMADQNIYTDQWGSFLSGYAPIRNSQGQKVGVIGVDLSAATVIERERQFLFVSLGVIILFSVIIPIFSLLIGDRIAQPIITLTNSANQIAAGDLSHQVNVGRATREIVALANDFNSMAVSLQRLIDSLESRVDERTKELQLRTQELEKKSKETERRANQLNAVSQVARAISTIQDLQDLLPNVSRVISQEFNFYHVGVFLIDDAKEYAVLVASNSEGGQRMLKRNHKLKIGEVGIVGFSAATGQARIALDTGEDAVYFDNPDLPGTRSEIAIPLQVGDDVIGVLDVQSEQTGAFDEEDIELLSIVADQVSIAIQNARQFQAAQKTAEEAEEVYRRYIRGEWRMLVRETGRLGYRYSKAGVGPLKAPVPIEVEEAALTGKSSTSKKQTRPQIVTPIKLRNEVIGILNVTAEGERDWEQDEIDITEAVAERVALAVENVRLLEASQSQASRERTISAVTARISTSVNLRSILQTAVEELGRIIPGSDVVIQLGKEDKE